MNYRIRKRGFTLIEVVISLVIFMIGALAIIRVFPPAFNMVQGSSYRNIATRMSDSIISQMRSDQSTPEAVFDMEAEQDVDGNEFPDWDLASSWQDTWEDNNDGERIGAVEGTMSKNGSLPVGPTELDYSASALSRFRFIRGERVTVQNSNGSGLDAAGDGDANNHPYIMTNSPYTADPNGGVRLFVEHEIEGVTINAQGQLDFSRATMNDSAKKDRPPEIIKGNNSLGSYVVQLFRSPAGVDGTDTGARFYVSYRYIDDTAGDGGTRVNAVINEPISFPDNQIWDEDESVSGGAAYTDFNYVLQGFLNRNTTDPSRVIIPGSVRVIARAALVFVDADDVTSGNDITIRGLAEGTLLTIPLGIDQNAGDVGYIPLPPSYTSNDFGDDTAYYSAFPNGKILVDYLVPDWRILFHQQSRTTGGEIKLPVNILSTFEPIGIALDRHSDFIPMDEVLTPVNFQKRAVTYGSSYPVIRTAYKALDQWATQISPSARSYVPWIADDASATNTRNIDYLPHEPWREYYWEYGTDTIYFHPSEAGKTVKVQFIPAGEQDPIEQILVISKDITELSGLNFAPSEHAVALTLEDKNGEPIGADAILGVTGISTMARTAWLEGKNYMQSVSRGRR